MVRENLLHTVYSDIHASFHSSSCHETYLSKFQRRQVLRISKYCKVSEKKRKRVLIPQHTAGKGSVARRGPKKRGTYCKYLKKKQKGVQGE